MTALSSGDNVLRSCKSRQISFVKFCNMSTNAIAIDWIDFNGRHQCYIANMKPGHEIPVKTFVGHPWMAYEYHFRHVMAFSPARHIVFFPEPSKMVNGMPTHHIVNVLSPMCSLEKLCLRLIHKHLKNKTVIDALDIPPSFKKRLHKLFYLQENPQLPVQIFEID